MKKFLLLLAALTILVGCSKDDGKNDNRLAGSSFRTDGYKTVMSFWGYHYHVIEFSTNSSGVAYWTDKSGKQNGSDGDFTYSLSYPDLYITKDDGTKEHYRFKDSRSFVYIKDDGNPNNLLEYFKM